MDNQRFVLYVGLALVLFLIWQAWQRDYGLVPATTSEPTSIESTQSTSDSVADVPEDLPERVDSATPTKSTTIEPLVEPSAQKRVQVSVETDVFNIKIDLQGADIRQLSLKTYPVSLDQPDVPLQLLHEQPSVYITQSGLLHDRIANQKVDNRSPSHHASYMTPQQQYELVEGKDTLTIPFEWKNDNGITVTKTYHFKRSSFLIQVDYHVENNSDTTWIGRQYRQLRHSDISEKRSWLRLPTYTGAAYYDGEYEKYSFSDIRSNKLNFEYAGGWIAMLQHYFVSAWIPGDNEINQFYSNVVNGNSVAEYIIGLRSEALQIPSGQSGKFNTRLYIGPKLQRRLEEIKPGLELTTDYGMFTPLCKPLFWLLEWFHKWVKNWGVAIILVTLLIKLAFYRLSESSYRSMAKMRKIQPRFQTIRERYADDKQKLNQAMWDLYKKEKINPLGGCLPILIQMPVFLSLYWVLIETVEMRQAPFIFWIQDLSIKDPLFVLPLLMGITMFIQFKLNPTPPDPVQEKVFMMMPIFMTAFMAFFPAGLVLYWFVNNLLSIAQQWVITRRVERQK